MHRSCNLQFNEVCLKKYRNREDSASFRYHVAVVHCVIVAYVVADVVAAIATPDEDDDDNDDDHDDDDDDVDDDDDDDTPFKNSI